MQSKCCTEEGFDSFLWWWWLIWNLVWKLLVSNYSWTSTNESPTFFHPHWQIGNCPFFIVGLNKGLVLSVAHLLFSKQTEFLSRGSERISYLCRPSEQLSWDKINDKQSLSIVQTVIIVWHSPQEYIASINQHSVGVFLLVLSDASVIFVGHLNNIHETKLIINKVYP